MPTLSDAQMDAIAQQIAANPAILKALADDASRGQGGRLKYAYSDAERAAKGWGQGEAAVLQQFGITLPHDYHVGVDKATGQPIVKHLNWFQRNQDWILPVAVIGTAGAASVLSGPGAAAGSGGAAAGGSGGGAGAAAGGAAAASTPSILHQYLPTIIGAGAAVGGAAIQAKAQSDAAKKEAEAQEKALQVQKEQYALQRQDTAPYRALGLGAVSNLGFLGGIDTDSRIPELSATVPKVPYGQTAPPAPPTYLSQLGQPATSTAPAVSAPTSQFVPMNVPGRGVLNIPQDKVAEAQQRGAQMVNA